jgi:hypothetical protein
MTLANDELVSNFLSRLQGVKRQGRGWKAQCPAHEDRHASMSVGLGAGGRVLIKCHAGCPPRIVVAALGMSMRDLFPVHTPQRRSRGHVRRWQVCDAAGRVCATHCRRDTPGGKLMWWAGADGRRGLGGFPASALPLYGSELVAAADASDVVVLCEGEKAADAVGSAGLLALGTVTGASGTPSDGALSVLAGRQVCLWPDEDQPGRAHMTRIAQRLQGMGACLRWVDWSDAPPGSDAADAFHVGGESLVRSLVEGAGPSPAAGLLEAVADAFERLGVPSMTSERLLAALPSWAPRSAAALARQLRQFGLRPTRSTRGWRGYTRNAVLVAMQTSITDGASTHTPSDRFGYVTTPTGYTYSPEPVNASLMPVSRSGCVWSEQ